MVRATLPRLVTVLPNQLKDRNEVLSEREHAKGSQARIDKRPRTDCPWHYDCMLGKWWIEGWESVSSVRQKRGF